MNKSVEKFMRSSFVAGMLAMLLSGLVFAQTGQPAPAVHAIAMHGVPKYGPDFKYFDYVNPTAPKGGTLKLARRGTFDSFNVFIDLGNPASTGSIETLLTSSSDEPFTEYGLVAESLEVPEDRSWVIFNLREQARWHDGVPITAEDVVWSFDTLMTKGQGFFRFYYKDVLDVEKLTERKVKFTFGETENRELPLIVGQIPILPKHYWETRDFSKTTLEPPLGSGPYRIKDFEPGRFIVQERVKDYWGVNLPVNVGLNNFDEIRTDFYRDDTVIRLALKSGDIDFRSENQAKAWASDYNVPAVEEGWLKREFVKHQQPTGMQAFVMNTRRPIFQDKLVRKALDYAFDFEWTNRNLLHGQYTRTESFFSNTELAATGEPVGEELEILERFRSQLPPEVFNRTYSAPQTDGSGAPRENLRMAQKLLAEAGWVVQDLKLVHRETGQKMSIEVLIVSPAFERIILPFQKNLSRLGIDASIRLVDQTQYINRVRSFDFDMIVSGWGQSNSPGNEQRDYWSSIAADREASRNYCGIKDPVIDQLIDLVIQAPTRESLVARTRALDRVLLAGHYVIPQWHIKGDRILYWDKFSRPEKPVRQGTMIGRWWFDAEKAEALDNKMENYGNLN